jgi:hypothetical protein
MASLVFVTCGSVGWIRHDGVVVPSVSGPTMPRPSEMSRVGTPTVLLRFLKLCLTPYATPP